MKPRVPRTHALGASLYSSTRTRQKGVKRLTTVCYDKQAEPGAGPMPSCPDGIGFSHNVHTHKNDNYTAAATANDDPADISRGVPADVDCTAKPESGVSRDQVYASSDLWNDCSSPVHVNFANDDDRSNREGRRNRGVRAQGTGMVKLEINSLEDQAMDGVPPEPVLTPRDGIDRAHLFADSPNFRRSPAPSPPDIRAECLRDDIFENTEELIPMPMISPLCLSPSLNLAAEPASINQTLSLKHERRDLPSPSKSYTSVLLAHTDKLNIYKNSHRSNQKNHQAPKGLLPRVPITAPYRVSKPQKPVRKSNTTTTTVFSPTPKRTFPALKWIYENSSKLSERLFG